MRVSTRSMVLLVGAISLTVISRPARAGSLLPNPAGPTAIPNGYTNVSSGTPKYVVNVTPNPAVFIPNGNCPWLLPALAAEGFAQADPTNPGGYTGANGWTINFMELSATGIFTRQIYYPWADKAPSYSLGGLTVPAINAAGNGGDEFALTYAAGTGNPTGANAEWVQVIKANDASATEKMYGYNAGGGYTEFIDNFYAGNTPANNGTMNPTYDGGYTVTMMNGNTIYTPKGYAANPNTFIDTPSSTLVNGLNVQFQVFLVTDNTTTKTLTIYDGVWWGFQATTVPEPSSWILLVSACGLVAFTRRHDLWAKASGCGARPGVRVQDRSCRFKPLIEPGFKPRLLMRCRSRAEFGDAPAASRPSSVPAASRAISSVKVDRAGDLTHLFQVLRDRDLGPGALGGLLGTPTSLGLAPLLLVARRRPPGVAAAPGPRARGALPGRYEIPCRPRA